MFKEKGEALAGSTPTNPAQKGAGFMRAMPRQRNLEFRHAAAPSCEVTSLHSPKNVSAMKDNFRPA